MTIRDTSSSNSLAPGFRFHPTDQELVRYYLKRKVTNKPTRSDPIASVDIYKSEPWDLPSYSKLKTRDLEWYFFSVLDKKYGNGSKTNRATEKGYWKTTGNDRAVNYGNRKVGMKKTLVYHLGRAPKGERSNWVMHEYRLTDEDLEKAGVSQDAYVLCRVFQKSGTGPKNGEKYGAPFIEEEWEDEDVAMNSVPGEEQVTLTGIVAADGTTGDHVFYAQDPGKNVDLDIPNNIPTPLNYYYGDSSNSLEQPVEYSHSEAEEKPVMSDDNLYFDIPEEFERDLDDVKHEFVSDFSNNVNPVDYSNNVNPVDYSYLYDNNYVEATDNNNEGLYIETNDLPQFTGAEYNDFDVEEYLTFFDADGETSEPVNSELISEESTIPEQALATEKAIKDESEQVSIASQHVPETHGDNEASLPEPAKFESADVKYPFMKQASHLLSNIPAPPAFASEFRSKDAIRKLNSEGQSSSSVHVNAGIIRIRNVTLNATGIHWSYDKSGNLKVVFSFSLLENMAPTTSLVSSKTGGVASRSLFFLMLWWVLILSVSFKTASYIYTK